MLQSLDEVRKVEMVVGQVINGVDNANLLSVDSTTPIQTESDLIEEEKKEGEVEKKEVEEKKVELIVDPATPPTSEPLEAKPESKGIEKRIGDLTKKFRSAERERDYERTKRLEAEEELQKIKSTTPTTDKPIRDNFDDDAAFFEALTDWKVDQKLKSTTEKVEKDKVEVAEKQANSELEQTIVDTTDRGREKYEDFDTLVFAKDLVLSTSVLEIVVLSDMGEDILYYLAKHPEESAEISEMSALRAAKEIGKIELKLAGVPEKKEEVIPPEPAPAPRKSTTAPAPIEPVRANGVVSKDPSDMSPKEYRAWREANK